MLSIIDVALSTTKSGNDSAVSRSQDAKYSAIDSRSKDIKYSFVDSSQDDNYPPLQNYEAHFEAQPHKAPEDYIRDYYRQHSLVYDPKFNTDHYFGSRIPVTKPKFTIKPVPHDYFVRLKEYRNSPYQRATLPSKAQSLGETLMALDSMQKKLYKLSPMGQVTAAVTRKMLRKLRKKILDNKGASYATYYPAGHYDDQYEPDDVDHFTPAFLRQRPHPSERISRRSIDDQEPYVAPTNVSFGDTFEEDVPDDDRLIKKTFGYKVTIYKTPDRARKFKEIARRL